MQPRRREREKRERVCGCLHLTGLPCAGPFHILESIHGTILLGSILKYIDIYTCSVCFQLYLEAATPGFEVASVINLSEASGAWCLFVYDWGVIGFCPPGTRDTYLVGRCPYWLVGGRRNFRKSSDFLSNLKLERIKTFHFPFVKNCNIVINFQDPPPHCGRGGHIMKNAN